jgi:DNA-binding PadR family transcriptional regulator
MSGGFDWRFAYQFQGAAENWEGWAPPWMHRERHGRQSGPHVWWMRMRRGGFGPGGPFGPHGPFGSGPEEPFGPGEVRRFFGRGDVKYALLELVQERPMHGYEMMKALEEKSGGFYVPSAGSIYPTLQMLEDRGLLTVAERDGKKVYSITDEGRAFLSERQKTDEEFQRQHWAHHGGPRGRWNAPEIKALRGEAAEVARLFGIAGRISFEDPAKIERMREIIGRTRKDLFDLIYGTEDTHKHDTQ